MVQTVFNGALGGGEYGRFCRRLRRWLLRVSDPFVVWKLNGRELRIPLSHQLPFYRREFPTYSANLERLAATMRRAFKRLKMVDVGANVGDSLALAGANPGDAFLLIEGDPSYYQMLRQNTRDLPQAVCVQAMLSDKPGDRAVRLVTNEGTGKLVTTEGEGAGACLQTLDDLLEAQPVFRESQLLKIDVDGYDLRVLRGGEQFIRSAQPVVFFEQDPVLLEGAGENPDAVWDWLREQGYETVFLYDNVGYWLGSFPLGEPKAVRQLNFYARQHPGYYYDVAAFAPRYAGVRDAFAAEECQFYRRMTGGQ